MEVKRYFLIVFLFVFLISIVAGANYNVTSLVISEGGVNATSTNYQTDIVTNTISGSMTSALYKLFLGFWYSVIDTTAPLIIWESPTPTDGDTIDYDSVYLNTTITDLGSPNNISAWFDWNKSLVGYWAMDFYNSTGIFDNSTYNNFGTFAGGLGTDNITTGKYGYGLYFNREEGNYLNLGNQDGLDIKLSDWTAEAWIKTGNTGVVIVSKATYVTAYKGWVLSVRTSGRFLMASGTGTSHFVSIDDGVLLNDSEWHHVVGVWDRDGYMKRYVDGVPYGTDLDISTGSGINLDYNEFARIGVINYTASPNFFNGSIDEVKIFNRALSPEEINASYNNGLYRLYHNFTDLDNGVYNYSAYAIDTAGNLNVSVERTITLDYNTAPNTPSPSLVSVDGTNKTNDDLNCSALITDDDSGDTLDVTVQWFKNDVLNLTIDYNNSYSNATVFSAILESGNTTKTENWTCGLRVYDGDEYSDWVNSSKLEILNTLPVVTLVSPANYNITTNRTPEFSWSGSDDDGDSLYYDVNISCYPQCSIDNRLIEDIGGDETYVITAYLQYLKDNNDYYNWSVRASDDAGDTYGEWADDWKIEIQAEVIMSLPVDNINFGSLGMDATSNTTGGSPAPFEIQNDGNCLLNISLNATDLWTSIFGNSSYYQYKIDNKTGEEGSFNWDLSDIDWTQVPNSNQIVIVKLNWSDATDSAEMDLLVTVPPQESAGDKSSTLHFTAELGE